MITPKPTLIDTATHVWYRTCSACTSAADNGDSDDNSSGSGAAKATYHHRSVESARNLTGAANGTARWETARGPPATIPPGDRLWCPSATVSVCVGEDPGSGSNCYDLRQDAGLCWTGDARGQLVGATMVVDLGTQASVVVRAACASTTYMRQCSVNQRAIVIAVLVVASVLACAAVAACVCVYRGIRAKCAACHECACCGLYCGPRRSWTDQPGAAGGTTAALEPPPNERRSLLRGGSASTTYNHGAQTGRPPVQVPVAPPRLANVEEGRRAGGTGSDNNASQDPPPYSLAPR